MLLLPCHAMAKYDKQRHFREWGLGYIAIAASASSSERNFPLYTVYKEPDIHSKIITRFSYNTSHPALKTVPINMEERGLIVHEVNGNWYRLSEGWVLIDNTPYGKDDVTIAFDPWQDWIDNILSDLTISIQPQKLFYPSMLCASPLQPCPKDKVVGKTNGSAVSVLAIDEGWGLVIADNTMNPDKYHASYCSNSYLPQGKIGWVRLVDDNGAVLVAPHSYECS
jgi:hypothetical protein